MPKYVAAVLLFALMVAACVPGLAHAHSLLVSPQELSDALALGEGVFIDLRTEKAYNQMHIPGFELLEYEEEAVLALAHRKAPVYLICTAGRTAAKAYNLLLDAGVQEVHAAVFGVEEYAEAMGLESMEGADICIPCLKLQKSLLQESLEQAEAMGQNEGEEEP